MIIYPSKNLSS